MRRPRSVSGALGAKRGLALPCALRETGHIVLRPLSVRRPSPKCLGCGYRAEAGLRALLAALGRYTCRVIDGQFENLLSVNKTRYLAC